MLTSTSNVARNTRRVSTAKVPQMHASAERLYKAARDLGNTFGQSAVAKKLNESPQTVKNWETRGISAEGAITAEELFGCRAAWIRSGDGDMALHTVAASAIERIETPTFETALPVVLDAIAACDQRAELRALLPMLVDTNATAYRQRLAELLTGSTAARLMAAQARFESQDVLSSHTKI